MTVRSTRAAARPLLFAGEMAASLALGLGWCPAAVAQEAVHADIAASDDDRDHTILVIGDRIAAPAVDRIATDPVDTPQTITTITRAELEARGVSNLNDALRNVAGLSLGAGETSFQGNNAILRGFTTRNDLFVDNARDFGYYYRDTFDDQSIEVLKGPAGILFGRGSTGGIIHRVSKGPLDQDAFEGTAQFGSDETRRITLDANLASPFGAGNALRINAFAHHSGVADRDGALAERWGVAPALVIGRGTATRFSLRYLHQEENNRPDYGIPWYAGTPAHPGFPVPVARDSYYGFANDRLNTSVNLLTGRLEHDLGKATSLNLQLRYSNNTRDFRYSEAVLPPGTTPATPIDSITISRNLFEGSSRDIFLQGQADLHSRFATGILTHELIAGFEADQEGGDPVYVTNVGVPTTLLTDPANPYYDNPANRYIRLRARTRSLAAGIFAIDTVQIGARWIVIGGLRWDSFHTDYTSTRFTASGAADRATTISRTDRKLSYRGAIVFKPGAAGSIYVAYANSFNPSGEGIESLISAGRSVAEANINLAPETSYTVELGSKWALFGGRALLAASVFRIEKQNARVPDPTTPGFNTLGGNQRVDGVEVEASGQPLPGWNLHAGYSYLDSATTQSAPGGPIVGAPLIITPRHSGFFSTSYDVTRRLNLGLNLVASASRLGQNTAASYLVAGGYAVVDLSARYVVSRHLAVQLLANNVGDTRYYDQLHPAHVIPGAGRSVLGSIKLDL